MDWLAVLGPSILGVIGGAAVNLVIVVRTERRRRRGVRMLVTQELWHNQTILIVLRAELETSLQYDDACLSVADFRATAGLPRWQRVRWELPDVDVAFDLTNLTRVSEWYVKLEGLTLLYDRLMKQVVHLNNVTQEQGAGVVEQIKGMVDYVADLLANPPPLPDERLERDRGMKRYVRDLLERTGPMPGAGSGEPVSAGKRQ